MQFKKGADIVSSTGEKIGALDRVVMDPKTREVAYLVVRSGILLREDRLIPIGLLNSVKKHRIEVNASKENLNEYLRYDAEHYIPSEHQRDEMDDVDTYYWYPPAFGLHSMGQYPPFSMIPVTSSPKANPDPTRRNIPPVESDTSEASMVSLKEGAKVIARDDKPAGEVESLLVDEETDRVTHLVISRGALRKERKMVPAYWLTNVAEDEVRLAVESDFLDGLPEIRSEDRMSDIDERLTARVSATINAPASKVWEALTTPELIKKYLFGTDVISDWKEGSPIIYKGEWQGKSFEDKGKILVVDREKRLVSTHWSPLSGTPDTPENYHTVTYELTGENGQTQVTIIQDNNANEEEKAESERNWRTVLDGLKDLLEKR